MTAKQNNTLKVAGAVVALIAGIFSVVAYVNSGVDERIDNKIIKHEKEFEAEQRVVVGEIKEDVATLKEQGRSQQRQLDVIQQQGQHTQELVEQLIRDR